MKFHLFSGFAHHKLREPGLACRYDHNHGGTGARDVGISGARPAERTRGDYGSAGKLRGRRARHAGARGWWSMVHACRSIHGAARIEARTRSGRRANLWRVNQVCGNRSVCRRTVSIRADAELRQSDRAVLAGGVAVYRPQETRCTGRLSSAQARYFAGDWSRMEAGAAKRFVRSHGTRVRRGRRHHGLPDDRPSSGATEEAANGTRRSPR